MKDIHICTKDDPWGKSKAERGQHPDAEDVGECYDSCCDLFKCPHCGITFKRHNGSH